VVVVGLTPDSAAAKSQIQIGDVVTKCDEVYVDQLASDGLKMEKIASLLLGGENTEIIVGLQRGRARFSVRADVCRVFHHKQVHLKRDTYARGEYVLFSESERSMQGSGQVFGTNPEEVDSGNSKLHHSTTSLLHPPQATADVSVDTPVETPHAALSQHQAAALLSSAARRELVRRWHRFVIENGSKVPGSYRVVELEWDMIKGKWVALQ